MADLSKRNAAIMKAMKDYTAAMIADPAKLAAWAEEQRKFRAEFDAYMAKEDHGDCYCARCMSEFVRAEHG